MKASHNLAIGVAMLVSGGWVIGAGLLSTDKSEGSRGGAIAVIVSLCVFFLRRNYGERVIDSTPELYPNLAKHIDSVTDRMTVEPFSPEEATYLLLGMFGRINEESREQQVQNITLFWTSLIGTLFWGFGDIPTSLIIQHRLHP